MSGLVLDTCFFFSQAFSSREKKEWSMYSSSERNVDDERLYRRIAVWEHHTSGEESGCPREDARKCWEKKTQRCQAAKQRRGLTKKLDPFRTPVLFRGQATYN